MFFRWSIFVFFLAIALRLLLAIVNREPSGEHFAFIRSLADSHFSSCAGCIPPLLYHYLCALLMHSLSIYLYDGRLILCQLLSAAAGIGTLTLAYIFIKQLHLSYRHSWLCFSIFALNPRLIAIDTQASPESFFIFFTSLAIFSLWKILKTGHLIHVFWLTAGLALGTSFKIQGLLVAGACIFILALHSIFKRRIVALLLLCVLYAAALSLTGRALPKVAGKMFFRINPTAEARPGYLGFQESFLDFKIEKLLQSPIEDLRTSEITHSYWTRIFASAYSLHSIEPLPSAWKGQSSWLILLSRMLFALGLLPWLVGIVGFLLTWINPRDPSSWIFPAIWSGALVIHGVYCSRFIDFSAMNASYLYAASLCLIRFWAEGLRSLEKNKFLSTWFNPTVTTLSFIYCGVGSFEVALLIQQLHRFNLLQ